MEIALSEFDAKLHYKKGCEKTAADCLSRCCLQILADEGSDKDKENIQTVHDMLSHPGINCIYQMIRKTNQVIRNLRAKIKKNQARMLTVSRILHRH